MGKRENVIAAVLSIPVGIRVFDMVQRAMHERKNIIIGAGPHSFKHRYSIFQFGFADPCSPRTVARRVQRYEKVICLFRVKDAVWRHQQSLMQYHFCRIHCCAAIEDAREARIYQVNVKVGWKFVYVNAHFMYMTVQRIPRYAVPWSDRFDWSGIRQLMLSRRLGKDASSQDYSRYWDINRLLLKRHCERKSDCDPEAKCKYVSRRYRCHLFFNRLGHVANTVCATRMSSAAVPVFRITGGKSTNKTVLPRIQEFRYQNLSSTPKKCSLSPVAPRYVWIPKWNRGRGCASPAAAE